MSNLNRGWNFVFVKAESKIPEIHEIIMDALFLNEITLRFGDNIIEGSRYGWQ
jgi:hypothetical protein